MHHHALSRKWVKPSSRSLALQMSFCIQTHSDFLLFFIVLSSMEFVHSGHQYWFCIRAEFKVVLDKSGWVQDEHNSWNHEMLLLQPVNEYLWWVLTVFRDLSTFLHIEWSKMKSLKQKAWVRWTFSSRSPSPPFFFPSPPYCSFLSSSPGSSPSNSKDLEVNEERQLMPDHWNNCICEAASLCLYVCFVLLRLTYPYSLLCRSLKEIWQRIVNLDKFTNWKPSASSIVKHFVVNKPATSEKISFHEIEENQVFKHLCKICNLRKILGLKIDAWLNVRAERSQDLPGMLQV